MIAATKRKADAKSKCGILRRRRLNYTVKFWRKVLITNDSKFNIYGLNRRGKV